MKLSCETFQKRNTTSHWWKVLVKQVYIGKLIAIVSIRKNTDHFPPDDRATRSAAITQKRLPTVGNPCDVFLSTI